MKAAEVVAEPPAKPLVLYDGDCGFCRRWVARWQETTAGAVEFLPFQDSRIAAQFPQLARQRLEQAVHLVETDGSVWSGAEAVFRSLAHQPRERWLLDCYQDFPLFARTSEWAYGVVARHRGLFSRVSGSCGVKPAEAPSHQAVRWVFLRALGVVYLVAFISLWVQIPGLLGANGILPVGLRMEMLGRQAAEAHLGWERYHAVPTLCWLSGRTGFLEGQCAAGTLLAALLILNVAPASCLVLLWGLYLSLVTVGGEFLSFQWDNLLLETGFLAIFFAPLQLRPRLARAPPPSGLMFWLLRWLLFRLMFASGGVKLLSGDPTWRNLTALAVHYETQPLPTWIGWYAFQLPARAQQVCTALMYVIELAVPFLIFGPRRWRQVACGVLIGFQALIFLTGNYGFFNLLTMALCLLLLDDAGLRRLVPGRWQSRGGAEPPAAAPAPSAGPKQAAVGARWPRLVLVPLALVVLVVSLMQLAGMFGLRGVWPRPIVALYYWLAPLRSCNHYGLFAVMTTTRREIIVEGSRDGTNWVPYEFKYKPGEVQRRPGFVAPHQPRLDWQMWFAALGDYRQNPWLVNFCVRLLQGSPEVTALLERNPFRAVPPRYVRAMVYEYHFTDWATRRRTGAWWRQELQGVYLPAMSLSGASSSP